MGQYRVVIGGIGWGPDVIEKVRAAAADLGRCSHVTTAVVEHLGSPSDTVDVVTPSEAPATGQEPSTP